MKKILFIDVHQFGQLTDLEKWCENLKDNYNIYVLCYDKGVKRIKLPNVRVTYLHYFKNKAVRGLYFLFVAYIYCLLFSGFKFVVFFPKCYLLKKLLPFKKLHIDYRTLSIHKDKKERDIENYDMQKALLLYDSASFISDGIRKKMVLRDGQKTYLLPLGADIISQTAKDFLEINLIYIGTLCNRRIIDTVKGLELFLACNSDVPIRYDIVGDGPELPVLKSYIEEKNLNQLIYIHGRKPYNELKPYLDKANIGVSYIPIVDYYQYQPPTKTFEYILSGLYCIATKTVSNSEIISDVNGILIDDNPESFAASINEIYNKRQSLNSEKIRDSLLKFQWKNIVINYLEPIISKG